ncbi:MAG TPA: ABC transporter ATP-binding protein [Ureibacillus sp.]|nr:ABC transporter ATP-binding protein [Ureibacillus sp.]
MAILSINQVNKEFQIPTGKVKALENISLQVEEGEFICIVGASGCGKSTLLRIIAGLEEQTTGTVLYDNTPITKPSTDRGVIFQESRLFPWLTVEKNIEFGISNALDKATKKELIQHYLNIVGLQEFQKAYPHQLSGGMQQRVSIARALINQPKILLLDEPFGALDALTKMTMQDEILRIREYQKSTMILVTHDIDEAVYLADRVVIMSSRPGTIRKVLNIQLPRNRNRNSSDFVHYRDIIYQQFFKQEEPDFNYEI